MEKIKILYIDDERINLLAFKSSFRKEFEVFSAVSAEEGFKILEETDVHIIIADQRMPETSGIEFFEEVKKIKPNPIRILITAYSDIQTVVDGINRGHVYRYITKPWNADEMRFTIRDSYDVYRLKEQNEILHSKYRKIFFESSDPILLFDEKGHISEYNKAATDLLMLMPQKMKGLSFYRLLPRADKTRKALGQLIAEGMISDVEVTLTLTNGARRTCLATVNKVLHNLEGKTVYQAILKDVTRRKEWNNLLMHTITHTQEKERERISQDLHDGLGQTLTAVKTRLEMLLLMYEKEPANSPAKRELEASIEQLKNSIEEIREICFNSLPPVLYQYGLVSAIDEIRERVSTSLFKINFSPDRTLSFADKGKETALFRVVQEFVSNSLKHAQANEVNIVLDKKGDKIYLTLRDDGVGFDVQSKRNQPGYGLKNIESRVELFNGEIALRSAPEEGTELNIVLPL